MKQAQCLSYRQWELRDLREFQRDEGGRIKELCDYFWILQVIQFPSLDNWVVTLNKVYNKGGRSNWEKNCNLIWKFFDFEKNVRPRMRLPKIKTVLFYFCCLDSLRQLNPVSNQPGGKGSGISITQYRQAMCRALWRQSKGSLLLENILTDLWSRTKNINSPILIMCLNEMSREGGQGLLKQK